MVLVAMMAATVVSIGALAVTWGEQKSVSVDAKSKLCSHGALIKSMHASRRKTLTVLVTVAEVTVVVTVEAPLPLPYYPIISKNCLGTAMKGKHTPDAVTVVFAVKIFVVVAMQVFGRMQEHALLNLAFRPCPLPQFEDSCFGMSGDFLSSSDLFRGSCPRTR